MPSTVVGAVALRKDARNCTPWVRSLAQEATRLDELAGRNHRSMADERNRIALTSRFDTQHAEAIFGVVERDPVDQAGQDLGRHFRFRLRLHRL